MEYIFSPAPEALVPVFENFRRDILTNNFSISSHANQRMVQRGISLPEMMEVIKSGQLGKCPRREGFLTCVFRHTGMNIIVSNPFGDKHSNPSIVTVFRDGFDDWDPVIVEQVLPAPVKETTMGAALLAAKGNITVNTIEAFSLEDLQREVHRRTVLVEQERKAKLGEKANNLRAKIATLQAELNEVLAELGQKTMPGLVTPIAVERKKRKAYTKKSSKVEDFQKAYEFAKANDLRNITGRASGKIRRLDLCEQFKMNYRHFAAWMEMNHPGE